VRRYGVLHPHAGRDEHDIARPAEFLVDSSGTVRWINLTGEINVRARPENVIKIADQLLPRAAAYGVQLPSFTQPLVTVALSMARMKMVFVPV